MKALVYTRKVSDLEKIFVKDSEGHEREIGELHEGTMVTYRDPSKHLLRKWDAYGFNKEAIDSGLFTMVSVILPNDKYGFISVDEIKTFGRVDSSTSEEPQYFVQQDKLTYP